MNFKDVKELSQFVKTCSKLGVKDFKAGEFSFSFHDHAAAISLGQEGEASIPQLKKVSRQASRAADAIEREAEENNQLKERADDHAESLVTDPEGYEDALIEEFADGNEREEGFTEHK